MWIYTPTGFISAVATLPDGKDLVVRARDRRSLDGLAELTGQVADLGSGSDYPYRLVVTRETLKFWLDRQVEDIDYHNFKNEAKRVSGHEYADVLSRVWYDNLSLEDQESAKHYVSLASKYGATD